MILKSCLGTWISMVIFCKMIISFPKIRKLFKNKIFKDLTNTRGLLIRLIRIWIWIWNWNLLTLKIWAEINTWKNSNADHSFLKRIIGKRQWLKGITELENQSKVHLEGLVPIALISKVKITMNYVNFQNRKVNSKYKIFKKQ